jgi:protein-S-isoprenylcysteine O-methyltransferase Ste14
VTSALARGILSVVFNVVFYGALLFGPAGTFDWPRAWFLLGVLFVATVATVIALFPGRRALIDERFKPPIQKGQPFQDKVLTVVLLSSYVGDVLLVGLDRFRLRLLPPPGAVVSWFGLVFFVAGWTLLVLAMRENTFAAPVVKHQKERGQRVIDTGVYGIVRHPMYAGGALFILGLPLFLESYAATAAAAIPIGAMIARIFVEERLLARELDGYRDYAARVRARLVPGVW